MADENKNKRLLQLQVLVRVDADDTDKARVLGGNLARQIEANIPNAYEVVGVELQSDDAEVTAPKGPHRTPEKDKDPAVLKT